MLASHEYSEEEALAVFECATRDLLRLSAAGFLAKYKRGEFQDLGSDPKLSSLAALIPTSLHKPPGVERTILSPVS